MFYVTLQIFFTSCVLITATYITNKIKRIPWHRRVSLINILQSHDVLLIDCLVCCNNLHSGLTLSARYYFKFMLYIQWFIKLIIYIIYSCK